MKKEPSGSFFDFRQAAGFTMTEIIAVILIASILAVVALPRLWDSSFDEGKLGDETFAALRYAQRTAIAHQRTVCATFSGGTQLTLTYASAYGSSTCDTNLGSPGGGGAPYQVTALGSTTYTAASSFSFDRIGRPSAGQTITLSGGPSVIVEAETGHVR